MIYNTSYINKTRLYYMTVLQMLVAVKMMHPAASRMYLDSCLHLFLKYKYPSEIFYVRTPMLRLFRAVATLPDPGPVHCIRTSQNSFFEAPFCFCFRTLASNHNNHNCTPSLKRTLRTTARPSDSLISSWWGILNLSWSAAICVLNWLQNDQRGM